MIVECLGFFGDPTTDISFFFFMLKARLILNSHTKLVMYFLSNGSIRSGKTASLLPPCPQLVAGGAL